MGSSGDDYPRCGDEFSGKQQELRDIRAISQKLSEIKTGIGNTQKHQKDERRSRVIGSINYYEQIAQSILSGDLSDELVQAIESHENDFLRVHIHIMEDIRTVNDEIIGVKDDELFGSTEIKRDIEGRQQKIGELYRELILCSGSRLRLATSVRFPRPGDAKRET